MVKEFIPKLIKRLKFELTLCNKIKVPAKDVTFVLMANNDMLSRASYGIGSDSDVTRSVAAKEFLNGFVFGDAELPTEPYSP